MEFSSAGDLETVSCCGLLNEKSHVGLKFLFQPLADMPGGYILTFLTCKGALVYHEVHGKGGLFYGYGGERYYVVFPANSIPYGHIGYARKYAYVS